MKIIISENSGFEYISNNFHLMFPYLKLELFVLRGNNIAGSNNGKGLSMVRPNIYFSKETTVKRLINDFLQSAGVKAVVLRKSGNVWIEPSFTEDWTLEQQNNEGEAITRQLVR